jgi:TrmH family RNA methyltransferase
MQRQGTARGAHSAVRRIDSAANPEWKTLRKALHLGGAVEDRYWLVETPRLLDEAFRSGIRIPRVYATGTHLPELRERYASSTATEWVEIGGRALESLSTMDSQQGLIALAEKPQISVADFFASQRWVVVLDRIQDPGNAGSIVRSAEAFGATGVVFLKGSASPDAPKVLRASAGSLFRIPFLGGLAAEHFLAACSGYALFAASPEACQRLDAVRFRFPGALVIGNEGAGVSDVLDSAAEGFRIPMERVESLNAAVSAGIALYQMGLQFKASAAKREKGVGR